MSKEIKNDGGPAFPVALELNANDMIIQDMSAGMTLRDWFAGMALQGIHASNQNPFPTSELVAQWAYRQADAMLEARDK